MTLITFAFCEKEGGSVGVTGLEVKGVDGVTGLDDVSDELGVVGFGILLDTEELDFSSVGTLDLGIGEGASICDNDDDELALLSLLTLSLCSRSKDSSSK